MGMCWKYLIPISLVNLAVIGLWMSLSAAPKIAEHRREIEPYHGKKLTIDGKEITTRDNATIIQAAHEAGIAIPHYCYHPKLSIAGQLPHVSRRVGGALQAGNCLQYASGG